MMDKQMPGGKIISGSDNKNGLTRFFCLSSPRIFSGDLGLKQ